MDSFKRVLELETDVQRLTGNICDLGEELVRLKDERERMKEMQLKAKDKKSKLKQKLECEVGRWEKEQNEYQNKLWEAESENKKLRIDLGLASKRSGGDLSLKLKVAEAEVKRFINLLEKKEETVAALLRKNGELERQDRGRESELVLKIQSLVKGKMKSVVEERFSELMRKIEGLEEEMVGRNTEIRRLEMECVGNRVREAEIRRLEEVRVLELIRNIEVLENDKGDMDAEIRELKSSLEMEKEGKRVREADDSKAISELVEKISVLEAEIHKLKMDNSIEAYESETMEESMMELLQKVGVFEKEGRAKDAEINELRSRLEMDSQAKRVIEDENQKGEARILDLVEKIEALEKARGKRMLNFAN